MAAVCVNTSAELPVFLRSAGPASAASVAAEAFWMPPGPVAARRIRDDAALRAVAGWPSRPVAVAVGDAAAILRSDDQGRSWTAVAPPASLIEAGDVALHDVVFAAPEHVVAVGGGLEPITAIGRAVVLISQDGGRGWTRADGLDVPRMTQIGRSADARALLATSDPDPATGTTTWQSVDGGRRWTPTTESLPPPERVDRGRDRFGWPAVRRGEVAVSVGDFGVIERLADGRWTTVRHLDATPAVLMVADRPVDLPWAIIGRHSLALHHRVAVAHRRPEQHAAVVAVASRIGVGSITLWDNTSLADQINRLRPACVVADARSLRAAESAIAALPTDQRPRLLASRLSDTVQSHQASAMTLDHAAMMVELAIPASDFVADAQMLLDPLTPPAAAVAVRSADAGPGPQRHLTDSIVLPIGCSRGGPPPGRPSRHRMQLATARITQLRLASGLLGGDASQRDSLAALVKQTESSARLRWLWRLGWAEPLQGELILGALSSPQVHPAVARYAVLRRGSMAASAERHHVAADWKRTADPARPTVLSQWGGPGGGEATSPFQIAPVSHVVPIRASGPPEVPEPTPTDRPGWSEHPAVRHCRGVGDDEAVQNTAWTRTRPRLDGVIDEPLWSRAARQRIAGGELWVAGDREFLYVAARLNPTPAGGFRVLIDTDDDPISAFWLTIGVDGSVHGRVDGTLPWTPRVYARADPGGTFEMAIRVDSMGIGPLPIIGGDGYAASVACLDPREPVAALPQLDRWLRVVLK